MAIISALSTFALCAAKNKAIAEKAIFFCPLFDCVDMSHFFLSLCCWMNLFNGRGSDILLGAKWEPHGWIKYVYHFISGGLIFGLYGCCG
jgi:hypothetical protein